MLIWTTVPFVVVIAVAIGYAVGKMPCWKAWQGYVGLLIVAPIASTMGIPLFEVLFESAFLARTSHHK